MSNMHVMPSASTDIFVGHGSTMVIVLSAAKKNKTERVRKYSKMGPIVASARSTRLYVTSTGTRFTSYVFLIRPRPSHIIHNRRTFSKRPETKHWGGNAPKTDRR